jgi:hypothetical protein
VNAHDELLCAWLDGDASVLDAVAAVLRQDQAARQRLMELAAVERGLRRPRAGLPARAPAAGPAPAAPSSPATGRHRRRCRQPPADRRQQSIRPGFAAAVVPLQSA